jgi:hypothetical protein
MSKLTLFIPGESQQNYSDVVGLALQPGGVTFYSQPDSSMPTQKKVVTNLPFLYEEEIGA